MCPEARHFENGGRGKIGCLDISQLFKLGMAIPLVNVAPLVLQPLEWLLRTLRAFIGLTLALPFILLTVLSGGLK